MKEIYDLRNTTNNPNKIVQLFFKWKFKKCIELAELNPDDVILDFGCGGKYLKKNLPDYNIICYDANPDFTEIEDYTIVKPNKIFAIDVLEHLKSKEIIETIKNFKKMNDNFILIMATSNENWFWKFSRFILGLPTKLDDHYTSLNEIKSILNYELHKEKEINFFIVSRIIRYSYNTQLDKYKGAGFNNSFNLF